MAKQDLMAKKDQLEVIKSGVGHWNRWRRANAGMVVDLSGADLSGLDLRGADLHHTHIVSADIFDLDEAGRPVRTADMGADLSKTDFTGADLSGADLRMADLRGANFSGANIAGAKFHDAKFHRTVLTDLDLSAADGLDATIHSGPSSIGVDSIYKSGGGISTAFLRATGVPDSFIAYIRSLTRGAIEFYSCFISYSSDDQKFAERLYDDLQANGVRCWFAGHDMRAGRKTIDQIDEAIRLHEKLLLVLSKSSMASEWVKTEIRRARKREMREHKQVLFPIALVEYEGLLEWELFDAEVGKDSAVEIREYFIPNFSLWRDHDSYQEAFQRLLNDLKTH